MPNSAFVKRAKVTIRHVAQDAGVSTSAVSKVLRNAYGVSEKMRSRVLKSIEKLEYRPSTAARGMRGHTYSIGILLVEMQNPFLPSVVEGAKNAFRDAGFQTLIGVGEGRASIESSLIDSMIDLRMDGILLVAPRLSGDFLARYAAQIPMGVIGHHEPGAQSFDTVNSDDALGARKVVDAMVEKGLKRIEMASLPPKKTGIFDVCAERERGYMAAMSDAGLSQYVNIWQVCETGEEEGVPLESILETDPLPEAIFCWSDIHALTLLNLAKMRGIAVPESLAIIGYDNSPSAAMPLIGLTSVDQHGASLGRQAAEALLARIAGRVPAEHKLVEPELLCRTSS